MNRATTTHSRSVREINSRQRSATMFVAAALALFAAVGQAQMAGACPPGTTQFDVRYDSNNGQSGNFFDVEATGGADVTITNMAVNIDAGGPYNIEVWTRPGTYVGFTAASTGWTMIVSESIAGVGLNMATPLATSFSQLIPAGQRVGFLCVLIGSTAMNYTNGTGVGMVSATDPMLTVYQGQGCGTPGFGAGLFTTRNWNGTLCYAAGPQCMITAPAPASVLTGVVQVDHDVSNPAGPTIATSTYEWSTDGGAVFNPCTPTMGSVNPALGLPAPSSQTFFWDSFTDGVGTVMVQTTIFRISLDDGMGGVGSCTVSVDMDNVAPPPTCTLVKPGGPVGNGDIAVDLTPGSPVALTVDATFDYSVDGGATWLAATPTAPSANPELGLPVGMVTSWTWDSRTDGVGVMFPQNAILRATVDDGMAMTTGECQAPLVVNNAALCQSFCGDCDGNGVGPDILDALTGAQIGVGLIMPTMSQTGCCDVNSSMSVDVVDALVMAQIAAGLPVMLNCPGANGPFCILGAPAPATIVGGSVSLDFDAYSVSGNMLAATFEYDDGIGFQPASDAGTGSLTGNPTTPFAQATGLSWVWDSPADISGVAFGVVVRITLTDVGPDGILGTPDDGGTGNCEVIVDVDNGPACSFIAPMTGGSVSSSASMQFQADNPPGNMLTAVFEYDGGGGFILATDAGTGTVTGNPSGAFAPGATDWTWDAGADFPMGGTGIVFRITLTDTITGLMSSCQITVDVVLGVCGGTVEGIINEAIVGLPQTVGDTTGADDTVVISCGVGGSVGGPDHVYQFIPATTQTYSFSLCASTYDTSLEVKEMDCIAGLTVACDDDACGPAFQSFQNNVPLTAGTVYYIVIDGWNGDTGAYVLDITTP